MRKPASSIDDTGTILAKFHPPFLTLPAGYVRREALLETLRDGLNSRIIIVTGSPGCGKTTLLFDLYQNLEDETETHRVSWLGIDADDQDSERCWRHIGHALLNSLTSLDKEKTQWAEHLDTLGSDQRLSVCLGNLCFEYAAPEKEYVLFVDGAEALDATDCGELLSLFSHYLPANYHLVLAATFLHIRNIDPVLLGSVFELNQSLMSFNLAQIEELVGLNRQTKGLPVRERHELALRLQADTGGWMAGINAILSVDDPPSPGAPLLSYRIKRYLDQFFRARVLALASPGLEEFLIEVSILETFNPRLCDHVTERSNSYLLLHEMLDRNLFIHSERTQHDWFELDPLFLWWLREQMCKIHASRIRELNNRASEWYEKEGMSVQAAKHLLLSSDSLLIQQLTATSGLYHPKSDTDFTKWVLLTPARLIDRNPVLCLLITWAYMESGRPDKTLHWLSCFEQAYALALKEQTEGDRPCDGGGEIDDEDTFRYAHKDAQALSLCVECVRLKCLSIQGNHYETIKVVSDFLARYESSMNATLRLVFIHVMGESFERTGRFSQACDQYLKGKP